MADWVRFLREEKLCGNDDPVFPATRVASGETRQFETVGLDRKHWSNATPIRKVFREAFERAGLPYFNPHRLFDDEQKSLWESSFSRTIGRVLWNYFSICCGWR